MTEELWRQTGNWGSSEISISRKQLPSLPWLEGHREEVMLPEPRSQDHLELLWASMLGVGVKKRCSWLLKPPYTTQKEGKRALASSPPLAARLPVPPTGYSLLVISQLGGLGSGLEESAPLWCWAQQRKTEVYMRANRPVSGPQDRAIRNMTPFLCTFKSTLLR